MINKKYKIIGLCFLLFMLFIGNINAKTVKVKITSNPKGAAFVIDNGSRLPDLTPATYEFKLGKTYLVTFLLPGLPPLNIVYKCDGSSINVVFPGASSNDDDKDKDNKVKVAIDSNPQGAYFRINNGDNVMKTPDTRSFKIGKTFTLIFTKEGYNPKNYTFKCDYSQTHIFVNLDPVSFSLNIDSDVRDADVFINDSKYGRTPLSITLNKGTYEIKVKKPGFKPYRITVNLNSNQNIYANLERDIFTVLLNVPREARIFVNEEEKNIKWDRDEDRKNLEWKTVTLSSNQEWNEVKVKFNGMSVSKKVRFDNSTLTLRLDLE